MKGIILTYLCAFAIGASFACAEKKSGSDTGPSQAPPAGEAVERRPAWPPGLGAEAVALEKDVSKKNYYIIFDGSGSMSGEKIMIAKKALEQFVKMIPQEANIGLLAFDVHGVSERAALGTSREKIIGEVMAVGAGGWTPLGQSVETAYEKLCDQGKKQLGYGEYYIVVVTDGRSTDGERLPEIIERVLRESPVVIHTIGFHIGTGHTLNQPGLTSYKTAQNFKELSEGLGEVLAESENF